MNARGEWQVYPVRAYPDDLWHDWQRLADRHHRSNPMLGSVFVRLLVEHFGEQVHAARFAAGRDLQAMTLLVRNARGIWQSFMPSQMQIAPLVISPQCALDVDALCRALPGFCPRLDLFGLDPDEHPEVVGALPHAEKYADNMRMEQERDFAFYWQGRSKNLQRNLTRYAKRLAQDGVSIACRAITASAEVGDAVDRYGVLESAGWKGGAGTALHPANSQGAFYRDLLVALAGSGHAMVFEMAVDDRLVASTLSISNDHEIIILKSTFDSEQKRYAFGRLVLHHYVEYVFDHTALRNIECYTNASKEQLSWATHVRPMFNASVYSSSPAATLLRAALSARARLQGALR